MSTQKRRKSLSLIEELLAAPEEYSFVQAARLIQQAALLADAGSNTATNFVAGFTPPAKEAIRFSTKQGLLFPTSEIASIKAKTNAMGTHQHQVDVNFMGLTGSLGVLPYHYTEMLLKRLKLKDESMQRFFDLFNHRTISLFYQASTKYSLPIQYEKSHLGQKKGRDNHTQALLSLIGLGTPHLTNRLLTKDESLLQYCGHLSQQLKSASSLSKMLQQHFSVPIKIKEFVGEWLELIDDVRSRLPSAKMPLGQNNCLGKSAMLGRKGWFAQGKVSIVIGPLNNDQLHNFSPGTTTLSAMNELVKLYLGSEYDYDFKILIKKSTVPSKVALSSSNRPSIGWNTWLSSKPQYCYNMDETVEISISSGRLQSPEQH